MGHIRFTFLDGFLATAPLVIGIPLVNRSPPPTDGELFVLILQLLLPFVLVVMMWITLQSIVSDAARKKAIARRQRICFGIRTLYAFAVILAPYFPVAQWEMVVGASLVYCGLYYWAGNFWQATNRAFTHIEGDPLYRGT